MIYVVTHKKFDSSIIPNEDYSIITVGNDNTLNFENRNVVHDNVYDNISDKNHLYCELTGTYWIYKNKLLNNYDYIGIVHYRRFFVSLINYFCYTRLLFKPKLIKEKKVRKYLDKHDIILPLNRCNVKGTVYEKWKEALNSEKELILLKNVIKDISPQYVEAYDICMNNNYFYQCNMFICKRKLFEKFFEWEYSILSEMEKFTNKPRIMGYIGEILTNIYVIKNNLKIKKIAVLTLGETIYSKASHS